MTGPALLETEGLTKLYGVVIGVNDMTLRLEPGVHGLLGPNGAGKSTLVKLITAQLKPSEGSIRVLGECPWRNPRLFERIGFCPEYDAFYPGLSGYEFVETLARIGGMPADRARERSLAVLEQCGATSFMDRKISTYSKGMRQRTKVAQALVHEPEFLILDEPLTGTDPVGRHELTELIIELGAAGHSILVASHVLHEVQAMTHNFLLIYGGRVLASGDVREIRSLMNEYPHRITLRCGRGASAEATRSLGARAVNELGVTGLEVDVATRSIEIATPKPETFYAALPELALDLGITIEEMSSEDDNLQAVFNYLTSVR